MIEVWIYGIVAGYLVGSIPIGLWIGRYIYGIDLRTTGSGKIGTTNAYRRFGLKWSLVVFIGDVSKGVVPVALIYLLFDSSVGEAMTALAVLIGHIYPVFAGFKGGRAAAPCYGVFLILTPEVAIVALLLGSIIIISTRIMSLAVVLGMTVSSVTQGLLIAFGGEPEAYYLFSVGAWLIILFAHRDNLQRLMTGRERVLGKPNSVANE